MMAIKLIMTALLAYAAIQDLKTRLVSDYIMLPFCALAIVSAIVNKEYISVLLAVIFIFTVFFMPESNKIGGADLLLIAGFTAYFGIAQLPEILICVCLLSLVLYAAERLLNINFITKNAGIALLAPAFLFFLFSIWRS